MGRKTVIHHVVIIVKAIQGYTLLYNKDRAGAYISQSFVFPWMWVGVGQIQQESEPSAVAVRFALFNSGAVVSLCFLLHQPAPAHVAGYGDDDIQAVETGLQR